MTDTARPVTIRAATRQDMAAVAAMAGEFHAFLAALGEGDPSFDVEATTAKLVRCGFGRTPLFSALIAEAGGEAVGYALYNIGFWADSLKGMVLLTDLFVREAWRTRGVGKALMGRLAETGRDEGCELILWTVWTKNERAKRFYEGLGAEVIDDEQLMKMSI